MLNDMSSIIEDKLDHIEKYSLDSKSFDNSFSLADHLMSQKSN